MIEFLEVWTLQRKLIEAFTQKTADADERRKELLDQNEMTGPVFKIKNDPRVTPIGRFLRKFSLNEIPQLWSVLKGDMSLVGPRPHALSHNREYEQKIALYARRHNVLPGITGWAQVNGFRGETDTDEKMRGRVDHDLYYIDNWSPWFDLRILLWTVFSRGV